MALQSVTITQESDLDVTWVDSNCPNLTFGYREQTFEECHQDDGSYVATYDTLVVPTGESFSMTYLCEDTQSTKTYTLSAGEYGIKP